MGANGNGAVFNAIQNNKEALNAIKNTEYV
jgi:hypothetical protein